LLNYGLDNLAQHADAALLWKADAQDTGIRLPKYSAQVNDFVIVGPEMDNVEKAEQKVRRVLRR
jgi:hypothetical protein